MIRPALFFILFVVTPLFAQSEEAMPLDAKIYVAGHTGLVGSAIMRKLLAEGYTNIVTRTSKELDLTDDQAVSLFFEQERPEYVFLAAAKVGGIKANFDQPADFIVINVKIQTNVITSAYRSQVKKLLFLGSSCIYPRDCPQPIKESYLLTGPLEETNKPYALAKIAGIVMCQSFNRQYGTKFIACMPTNLYGPNDNFDLNSSHVLPALIRKFVDAKEGRLPQVELWGTGSAMREFLHVDDMADAAIFLMNNYDGNDVVNIGCGEDISIRGLALTIKDIVGYEGSLVFNPAYPDGTPRKLLDVSKIKSLGWSPKISLEHGIADTVEWYRNLSE